MSNIFANFMLCQIMFLYTADYLIKSIKQIYRSLYYIDYFNDFKEVFCDFELSMCGFQQDILNKDIFGWRLREGVSISRAAGILTGPSEGAKGTGSKLSNNNSFANM